MNKRHPSSWVLIGLFMYFLAVPIVPIHALVGNDAKYFGGFVSFTLPCTCSTPGTLWIWYTPLYLGNSIPAFGALVYAPMETTLYPWYMVASPGVAHLGSYDTGLGACMITAPNGCIELSSLGKIKEVGTSRPF